MVRVVRGTKSDVQSVPCYCLNHGYNLSAANVKVIKAKTGGVCYTSDIVWTVPHTTAMPPAPAGGGSEGLSTPATPGRAITYVPHPPLPSSPLLSPSPPSPPPPPHSSSQRFSACTGFKPPPSLPSPLQPPLPPSSPPPPLSSPQRISGRTRSKTVRFSATPTVEFAAAQEDTPLPSPVDSDQGLRHSAGLISILDKNTLQEMGATNGAVDALCFKKWADMGGHEGLPSSIGGNVGMEKCGRIPCAFAAMLATRGDIDAALDDQQLLHNPPDLPQCYAADLRVPRSYQEALRTEHTHL